MSRRPGNYVQLSRTSGQNLTSLRDTGRRVADAVCYIFGGLLSGDIFLVPIHSHVRDVDQADALNDGHLRWPWPIGGWWSCGYTIVVAMFDGVWSWIRLERRGSSLPQAFIIFQSRVRVGVSLMLFNSTYVTKQYLERISRRDCWR